jgi:hypothetical protein
MRAPCNPYPNPSWSEAPLAIANSGKVQNNAVHPSIRELRVLISKKAMRSFGYAGRVKKASTTYSEFN